MKKFTLLIFAAVFALGVGGSLGFDAGAESMDPIERIAQADEIQARASANADLERVNNADLREMLAISDALIAGWSQDWHLQEGIKQANWAVIEAEKALAGKAQAIELEEFDGSAFPDIENAMKNQSYSVIKHGASDEEQALINYAYKISGGNKDFILTNEAENSEWSVDRRSDLWYNIEGQYDYFMVNGEERRLLTKFYDYGICQVSEWYYPEVVNDPNFSDPYWQVDQCWRLFSGGTRFYGFDVRHTVAYKFDFTAS